MIARYVSLILSGVGVVRRERESLMTRAGGLSLIILLRAVTGGRMLRVAGG